EVTAAIVGDHNLRERRRQVRRFGDDPHARFRAARAGHDAADVVAVDLDGGARTLAGGTAWRRDEHRHDAGHNDHWQESTKAAHVRSLVNNSSRRIHPAASTGCAAPWR